MAEQKAPGGSQSLAESSSKVTEVSEVTSATEKPAPAPVVERARSKPKVKPPRKKTKNALFIAASVMAVLVVAAIVFFVAITTPEDERKPATTPTTTTTDGEPRNCEVDCPRSDNSTGLSMSDSPRVRVTLCDGFDVMCDTETDGGGWILVQRRINGDVDFFRSYANYTQGFGDFATSFWLGLDNLRKICKATLQCQLRVDMKYEGDTHDDSTKRNDSMYYAHYKRFFIDGEQYGYRMVLWNHSGTAPDSLRTHNRQKFSTYDHDVDASYTRNCAERGNGGFWYADCGSVNLNGQWNGRTPRSNSWYNLTGRQPVSFSEMKVRFIYSEYQK